MIALFSWLYLVLASMAVSASTATLETYLKDYMAHDELIKQARARLKIQEQNLVVASDLYRNQLSFAPSYKLNEQVLNTVSTSPTEAFLSIKTTQDLPSATQLSYEYLKLFNDINNNILDSIGDSHKLTIRQSLRRNIFGSLSRQLVKQNEAGVRSAKAAYAFDRLSVCERGIGYYLNGFESQERLKIFKQIQNGSLKLLKSTRESYAQRSVRKIEWLSAQTDSLRVSSLVIDAEKQNQKSFTALLNYGGSHVQSTIQLASPKATFSNWEALPFKEQSMPEFEKYQELEKEKSLGLVASKKKNRSEVVMALELGYQEGINQGSPFSGTEKYGLVSLIWDWPISNKTLSSKIQVAKQEQLAAVAKLSHIRKELKTSFEHLRQDLQSTGKLLELSRQKSHIYSQQIKEALRMLKGGKIEFEDYVRFRDLYLNERISEVRLQSRQWLSKVELAKLQGAGNQVCLGMQ